MRAQLLMAFVPAVALVSCTDWLTRSPAAAADSIGGYEERAERQHVAWLKRAATIKNLTLRPAVFRPLQEATP